MGSVSRKVWLRARKSTYNILLLYKNHTNLILIRFLSIIGFNNDIVTSSPGYYYSKLFWISGGFFFHFSFHSILYVLYLLYFSRVTRVVGWTINTLNGISVYACYIIMCTSSKFIRAIYYSYSCTQSLYNMCIRAAARNRERKLILILIANVRLVI